MSDTSRSEDKAIAAAIAGHVMDGIPPTDEDIAGARRVPRGETTAEQETARLLAQLRRGHACPSCTSARTARPERHTRPSSMCWTVIGKELLDSNSGGLFGPFLGTLVRLVDRTFNNFDLGYCGGGS